MDDRYKKYFLEEEEKEREVETVGGNIKAARIKAGITQKELADRLGISPVGISQWERGLRHPKPQTINRIAKALGVSTLSIYADFDEWRATNVHEREEEWKKIREFDNDVLTFLYREFGQVQKKYVENDSFMFKLFGGSYWVIGKQGKEFYLANDDIEILNEYIYENIKMLINFVRTFQPKTEEGMKKRIVDDLESVEMKKNLRDFIIEREWKTPDKDMAQMAAEFMEETKNL